MAGVRSGPFDFVLEGGGGLEDVPAEDVAEFIHGVVRVVRKAAGHAVGRPVKDTGRPEGIVDAASRVRIRSLTTGSVALELLPAFHEPFPVGDNLDLDAETVSERALAIAWQTASPAQTDYADVARAWTDLGDRLGIGTTYTGIAIATSGGPKVVLDRPAIERLRRSFAETPMVSQDLVHGTLYEADFEASTAKLRDRTGASVAASFSADHADSMKEALRSPTTLVGTVTYDPRTGKVVTVAVNHVQKPVQLVAEDFWADTSARQVAAARQGVHVDDVDAFRIEGLTDGEWSDFLDALND